MRFPPAGWRALSATGRYGHNIAHQAFTATALPDLLGEDGAEQVTGVAAAELRTAPSRCPDDAYLRSLVAELAATSTRFRDRWERGEVGAWRSAVKRMRHPTRGRLGFDIEMLHDPERDHWIMLYSPRSTERAGVRIGHQPVTRGQTLWISGAVLVGRMPSMTW